jgi:hypothetical protein
MQPTLQPAVMHTDGVLRCIGRQAEHAVRIGIRGGEQHLLEVEPGGFQQVLFLLPEIGRCIAQCLRGTRGDFQDMHDTFGERTFAQAETLARGTLQSECGFQDFGDGRAQGGSRFPVSRAWLGST